MNDNDIINYLRDTGYGEVLLAAVEQGTLTDKTVTGPDGTGYVVREAAPELQSRGLVNVQDRMVGPIVEPTGRGKQIAARIRQSHESGEDRLDAVTRAVAAGLLSDDSDAWHVEEVDGRPVTPGQLTIAIANLERWGCAKPIKAWGDETVRLLPKDRVHEISGIYGLLRDHFEGRTGGSVDNSSHSSTHIGDGSTVGAVSTGSPNSVQNVTITTRERTEIEKRIQRVRDEMGDNAAPELIAAVDAIEDEAHSDTATKESFGKRVEAALVTATDAAIGAAGVAVISGLVQLLPAALGF